MQDELYIPPHYNKNTQEIFGKNSLYYYIFSAHPDKSYFYKSKTGLSTDREEMTDEEIEYLLRLVFNQSSLEFKPVVALVHYRFNAEKAKKGKLVEENKQAVRPKVIVSQPRYNNSNAEQRKAKQKDKILARFSRITPVILLDADQKEKAVTYKLNNNFYYISLNDEKPAFWRVSLLDSKPMSMDEVIESIEFLANPKTQHISDNLALMYKVFLDAKEPLPTKVQQEVLYSQIRLELSKGLQKFTPLERKLCEENKKRQR